MIRFDKEIYCFVIIETCELGILRPEPSSTQGSATDSVGILLYFGQDINSVSYLFFKLKYSDIRQVCFILIPTVH